MEMSPDTLEAVGVNELFVAVTVDSSFTTEQAVVGQEASDDDKQSTPRMRVRAHIYPDHSTRVNFSSHEYQPRNATDNIPGAHRTSKPTVW